MEIIQNLETPQLAASFHKLDMSLLNGEKSFILQENQCSGKHVEKQADKR